VIEIDGGQHALATEYDARRTHFLEQQGYAVIRFWNPEIMDNLEGVLLEGVLARIQQVLADMPSPSPSREREGSLWSRARARGPDVSC
jgi:very-short-patch-repair endonuclease